MFPLTVNIDLSGEVTSNLIINYLILIFEKKNQKIYSIYKYEQVRNLFATTSNFISHLDLVEQEQILEFQSDRTLKIKYNELTLLLVLDIH